MLYSEIKINNLDNNSVNVFIVKKSRLTFVRGKNKNKEKD
jgi:hypothetical protein